MYIRRVFLIRIKASVKYLFLVLFAWSCTKKNAFDCFKSTGASTTEYRYPGTFTKMEINDKIIVTVHKGNEFKIEVIAGKNIIKNISTEVSEGVLKIENKNRCNFVRGYKHEVSIHVTVPYLQMATNLGVADLKFEEGFNQDTLFVRNENSGDTYVNGTFNQLRVSTHGNGDFYLSGKANSFYIYTNGTNYVWAQDLSVTDYTFVESITLGDCYVNTSGLKKFDYHIESSGNIYYSGDPLSIGNVGDGTEKGKAIKKE